MPGKFCADELKFLVIFLYRVAGDFKRLGLSDGFKQRFAFDNSFVHQDQGDVLIW
jgi:hypothetical protein